MTAADRDPDPTRPVPGVIGRASESARLDRFIDELRSGTGGALAIGGLAGMGKSTLVAAMSDRASRSGVRVVRARGTELTSTAPWAIATTLVADLSATGASAGATGPASRAWELLDVTPDGPGSSFPIVHGIVCAMRDAAEYGPLLVVVDDAHLADGPTAPALTALAERAAESPIGVVITHRPSPGPGNVALEGALASGAFEHMRLAPLADDALDAIVRSWAPLAPPELRLQIVSAARGNPLLAREAAELCEHAITAGTIEAGRRGATSLDEIVAFDEASIMRRSTLSRLGASGRGAHQVAAAIAVLGSNADVARAAAVSGIDHDTVVDLIDELGRRGIVEYVDHRPAIRHGLVEQMVLADVGHPQLESLHHAAAGVLRSDGAPSEDVVGHLMRARGTGAPATWMPGLLRRSAERQLALGSAVTAAALLARARTLSRDQVERVQIGLEQARAEGAAGLPTARERLDAIAEEISRSGTQPSGRELVVFSAVGEAQYSSGQFSRAEKTFDRGLQLISAECPRDASAISTSNEAMNSIVAGLLAGRASAALLAGHRSRLDDSIDDLARERRRAPSNAVRMLAAMRAGERALGIDIDLEILDALIATAMAGPLPDALARAVCEPVGAALTLAGRPSEAHAVLTDLLDRATARGEAASHISLLPIRAQAALHGGDVDGALADALDALRLIGEVPTGSGYAAAPARYIAALAHLERDDLEAARSIVEDDDSLQPWRNSPMYGWFACGVGAVALARRDAADARAAFEEAGRVFTAGGGSGSVVGWRNGLAQALHLQGDTDRACGLLAEEAAHVAALGDARLFAENRRIAAMLQTDHSIAAEMLGEVVADLDDSAFPLDVAAADVERGMRLRRHGEVRAARDALRLGMDRAREAGSRRLARIAADELEAAGSRRPRAAVSGRDALTPAEYRVCSLAAQRRTNREIADSLFVSVKTVETQLSSAYRKLGVTGRDGLDDALAH